MNTVNLSHSAKEPGSSVILYNFIREVQSSGVRASISIVHIRTFFKMHQRVVRFRFVFRIAKRSISVRNSSAPSRISSDLEHVQIDFKIYMNESWPLHSEIMLDFLEKSPLRIFKKR